ncbi:MAG: hypothetical protein AB1439_12145 [candidate division FCPU426 bacterium]
MRNPGGFVDQGDGPPRIVLAAVGLLALLFLGGGVYLFISGPFTGIEVVAPAELPEVLAVVADYQGTLWGLEGKRETVRRALAERGWDDLNPITIYARTPLLMRPLRIECQVGFLPPLGYPVMGLPGFLRTVKIAPGRRLVVRVAGWGNFTGNKAYRAAAKTLRPLGLKPGAGERYELKTIRNGRRVVEHWIPVQ